MCLRISLVPQYFKRRWIALYHIIYCCVKNEIVFKQYILKIKKERKNEKSESTVVLIRFGGEHEIHAFLTLNMVIYVRNDSIHMVSRLYSLPGLRLFLFARFNWMSRSKTRAPRFNRAPIAILHCCIQVCCLRRWLSKFWLIKMINLEKCLYFMVLFHQVKWCFINHLVSSDGACIRCQKRIQIHVSKPLKIQCNR